MSTALPPVRSFPRLYPPDGGEGVVCGGGEEDGVQLVQVSVCKMVVVRACLLFGLVPIDTSVTMHREDTPFCT